MSSTFGTGLFHSNSSGLIHRLPNISRHLDRSPSPTPRRLQSRLVQTSPAIRRALDRAAPDCTISMLMMGAPFHTSRSVNHFSFSACMSASKRVRYVFVVSANVDLLILGLSSLSVSMSNNGARSLPLNNFASCSYPIHGDCLPIGSDLHPSGSVGSQSTYARDFISRRQFSNSSFLGEDDSSPS